MNNDLNQDSGRVRDRPRNRDLVVGLDAGGTRTRAVLASAVDGRVLGQGSAGPGNALTVPVPLLTDHLAEAIAQAVPEPDRARVVAVAGGFAGAAETAPDEPGRLNALAALTAALRRLGIEADSVGVSSDIEAAFASARGTPADGLALVAGTGVVAMRIRDRRCEVTVGGDGWLLGDDGGGFWIGRSAVRAALRMADGRGGPTTLADAVGRALGLPAEALPYAEGRRPGDTNSPGGPGRPDGEVGPDSAGHPASAGGSVGADASATTPTPARERTFARERHPAEPEWSRERRAAYRMHLLPAVMAEPPIHLARLAPLVAEAARHEDAVARAILDEAADHLLEPLRALEPRQGERIVATGGLLGPEGPLTALLSERLKGLGLTLDWVADGCRGAVALARLGHGRSTPSTPAT
ncbi:BadF/BadG/BcrA/BcrD ATPase family protein [Streptomyces sp. NBC_00258]|uniref:BadF/BadG/BcrA/BcrD ATPase family protein n=1 Tax=Streptomyces sp. NBC_00258 TaxID=2903642 RepID=UPI002E2C0556|nr:BadF/BadG/BcrA/BcrD ATPase family protein [Streptomyces sp. NBC_00258]